MFISQPIPFLNPVCPAFRIHYPLLCNCLTSSSLRTVSSSLYKGEVLVMGLELWNVYQSLLSFGIYICYRRSWLYINLVFSLIQKFRYYVSLVARFSVTSYSWISYSNLLQFLIYVGLNPPMSMCLYICFWNIMSSSPS